MKKSKLIGIIGGVIGVLFVVQNSNGKYSEVKKMIFYLVSLLNLHQDYYIFKIFQLLFSIIKKKSINGALKMILYFFDRVFVHCKQYNYHNLYLTIYH